MQQPTLQVSHLINNYSVPVQPSASLWPNDFKFRDQLSVPLTLTLCPIGLIPHHQESSTPSASFPSTQINSYRCHSCKAFINNYCTIRSKNEYDCSICGCTNRVSKQLNSLAPQMVSPVYTSISTSPEHKANQTKMRTFVFVVDLTHYHQESSRVVNYFANIMEEYLKQVEKFVEQKNQGVNLREQRSKIQIMLLGFDDRIHQYRIIQNSQSDSQEKQNGSSISKFEVQKIIDTHLSRNQSDLTLNDKKQNYFIELPKFHGFIKQILDDMIAQTNHNQSLGEKGYTSQALLPVLEKVINHTKGCMGKIYVISGYRQTDNQFINSMMEEPEQFRSNFQINKTKCLQQSLVYLLERTHMSISFFIFNNVCINLMPLYAITKLTNGELKLYNPNQFYQLYYDLHYAICTQSFQLGTECILKVRNSSGVKLVGTFGQYRNYKGGTDQIQLISCSQNRIYIFQFNIEGKVQQSCINIQFSILWTDANGNRIFKIITYSQKISNNHRDILDSLNYGVINQSYLWAILYNMDLNMKIKTLQLTLQERCRKHVKAIQKYHQSKSESLKKVAPYIMFTYYLMRHFIMNTKFSQDILYDKSIEARSRVITSDVSGIHTIWPVVYSVGNTEDQLKVVQMRYEEIKDTKLAVVVNQGDNCFVHIISPRIRKQVNRQKLTSNRSVLQIINQKEQLKQVSQILTQISQQKQTGYIQITLMQNLQGVCALDEKGPLSYSNFIHNLTS